MAIGGVDNRGSFYVVTNLPITTALTNAVQDTIANLDGATALTAYCNFTYGSGGTQVVAKVQTSLDGGSTWLDCVAFSVTTASAQLYAGITRGTIAVTNYAALSVNSVNNAVMGDRFRGIVTSTGTYATTTLNMLISIS